MPHIKLVQLLGLVALAGCGQKDTASVSLAQVGEVQPQGDDDPFYFHSNSWRLQPDESKNLGPLDAVEPRRLDQDAEDAEIKHFCEYLKTKGLQLRFEPNQRVWRTTEPIMDAYLIQFHLGAFPQDSTLLEMQMSLRTINLAFGLNPSARLAMSDPSPVRLTPSESDRRELEEVLKSKAFQQARDKLKRTFLDYKKSDD